MILLIAKVSDKENAGPRTELNTIPLATISSDASLIVLLHLLQLAGDLRNERETNKTVEFMNRLGYHHLQVFALLNIQLNLYSEVAIAQQYVGGMIDAFGRIQNEKHVDSLELPGAFDLINV